MARYADAIEALADYLWWLLPSFLKGKDRSESLVARFCEIWGEHLDDARTTLIAIIPELMAATATMPYLERIGRPRQSYRTSSELIEDYRDRVLNAWEIGKAAGTIPGMLAALALIGVTARIWEYRALSKTLLTPPVDPEEGDVYIVSSPVELTWDDWDEDEDELPWDEGLFDDWGFPTGAWEGHAGELAMWTDGAWVFLAPVDSMIVRVDDENEPFGRFYQWTGSEWIRADRNQWAHFIIEILAVSGDYDQEILDRTVREQKPAHTRAVVVFNAAVASATWDDWALGADPEPLDEGIYDDWSNDD